MLPACMPDVSHTPCNCRYCDTPPKCESKHGVAISTTCPAPTELDPNTDQLDLSLCTHIHIHLWPSFGSAISTTSWLSKSSPLEKFHGPPEPEPPTLSHPTGQGSVERGAALPCSSPSSACPAPHPLPTHPWPSTGTSCPLPMLTHYISLYLLQCWRVTIHM